MKLISFLFPIFSTIPLISSFRVNGLGEFSPLLLMRDYNKSFLNMRKSRSNSGGGGGNGGEFSGRSMHPQYFAKSENQKKYLGALNDPSMDVIFGVGPAGTGKTLFACSTAVQSLKRGNIQKIIMTRPVVPVEKEDIGFLPGNINNKMEPWTRPLFDILLEYYAQKDIDSMLSGGVIEIAPLAFMRGRTFKRCFIIADEMQNSTPNQMLMLLTRIGEGSKMVVTGDMAQSDRLYDNGLRIFVDKIHQYRGMKSGIEICEFGNDDIERSPVVRKILDIYDGSDNEKQISEYDDIHSCDLYDEFLGNMEDEVEEKIEKKDEKNGDDDGDNGEKGSCGVITIEDDYDVDIIYSENDADCALIPKKHISKNYQP